MCSWRILKNENATCPYNDVRSMQILAKERIAPYRKDVLATGKGTVSHLVVILVIKLYRSLLTILPGENRSWAGETLLGRRSCWRNRKRERSVRK